MSRLSWLARVVPTKGSGVFDFLSPAEACGPTPRVETQSSWFASMETAPDPGQLIPQRKSKRLNPFDSRIVEPQTIGLVKRFWTGLATLSLSIFALLMNEELTSCERILYREIVIRRV